MSDLYKLATTENVELNYDAFTKKELIECLVTMRSNYFRFKKESNENIALKIQISAREEEYRKLEDNWNGLKEWLKKELGDRINPNKDKWLTGVYDAYKETIDKIAELERGVSDDR